jgi:hypothetical protein
MAARIFMREQAARKLPCLGTLENPVDDLEPVQLVAVDRRAQPQAGPVGRAVDHLDHEPLVPLRRQSGDGDLDPATLAGRDVDPVHRDVAAGGRCRHPRLRSAVLPGPACFSM